MYKCVLQQPDPSYQASKKMVKAVSSNRLSLYLWTFLYIFLFALPIVFAS